MRFRIQHNHSRSQPRWAGDYVRLYGARNEGFVIDAQDEADAKRILREQHNLNPFYVNIKPEQSK